MGNHHIDCDFCGRDTRGLSGVKGCYSREEADRCGNCEKPSVPALASHPAGQSAGSGAEDFSGKFWLHLREPRRVPDQKGPFPSRDKAKILREFMAARPQAYISVVTVGYAGPEFEDGPQALQILDGRSMATGSKHIERVRTAHGDHSDLPAPDSTRAGQGEETVAVPASALRWLFGDGPDADGVWFGDQIRGKGAFWWRSEFRKRIEAARPAAPEAQGAWRSRAADDVLAERRRQVEAEGWTPAHDDGHRKGELGYAAACYAAELDLWTGYEQADRKGRPTLIGAHRVWPWSREWWKLTDRRRNLVKAGALILAEIERLDRLPAPPASSGQGGR